MLSSIRYGLSNAIIILASMSITHSSIAEEQLWLKDFFAKVGLTSQTPFRLGASIPAKTFKLNESKSELVSQRTIANIDIAIRKYRDIHHAGGWPRISQGKSLRRGDNDARVINLRRRLSATGDLVSVHSGSNRTHFDGNVEEAVKRFQHRHGLTPSGRINRFTLEALNVSSAQRLNQLIDNRGRIRNLVPKTAGRRYVVVNIPAYELQAVRDGKVELHSRTVVGKPVTPTPVLSAKIKALNMMPYWHVPQSIVRRNLIPAIRRDPHYLVRNNFRVLSGTSGTIVDVKSVELGAENLERLAFRQEPGPNNALGLLRIDMSNEHNVYMHDTPLKKLFRYHLRPYSAGCVRVQKVIELGEWLLRTDKNSFSRHLRVNLQARNKATIVLRTPVDVHFAYITAWATAQGDVQFRHDIYGKDQHELRTASFGNWATQTISMTQ